MPGCVPLASKSTVAGLPGALCAIDNDAVCVPTAVGENVTFTVPTGTPMMTLILTDDAGNGLIRFAVE